MKRKPDKRLTVAQARKLAGEKNVDEICAGQVRALQWWLDRWEMTASKFAQKYGLSVSTMYAVLALKMVPNSGWWRQVAKGFGMELWGAHASLSSG